jgi:hypothetical protein
MDWKKIGLITFICVLLGLLVYYVVFKKESFSNLPEPKDWVMSLYKTLNWDGAPMSDDPKAKPVPSDWINWAKTSPNSILQYYVNYRRTSQGMLNTWPTTDNDIILNPVYAWDGLANAIYIWNKAVDYNNQSSNKPLGNVAYFCNEDDEVKRKMTLAAFLGNATVESAFFLVCKESTHLVDGTMCPGGYTSSDPSFNPRYFNNCDQADPMTYSCEGGAGGGSSGGGCSPGGKTDMASVCSTVGCYPKDPNKNICNVSNDGTTWASWDETIIKDKATCDSKLDSYKFAYWCPGKSSAAPSGPTPTSPPFNPIKDKCTGGWPVCQFPGADGKFISLPPTDPCMTDPYADGSMRSPLDNSNPTCSDWNGNKWKEQQECYFGRGLIQLTWSCNYYQAQRNLYLMASLISANNSDPLLQEFKKNVNLPFTDSNSINLCANPDSLCGSYSIQPNAKVIYSNNDIARAIPWLSCIIYWATKCAPAFNKCYSFSAAYQGIAPSGAGNPLIRVTAMRFMMSLMGENINDTSKYVTIYDKDGKVIDFRLNLQNCDSAPGPGPKPAGNTGSLCGDGKDWTFNKCQNQSCVSDADCPSGQRCFNSGSTCDGSTPSPTRPRPPGPRPPGPRPPGPRPPGPSPTPSPYGKTGSLCGDGKDWTFNKCQNQSCLSDVDCPSGLQCFNAAGAC